MKLVRTGVTGFVGRVGHTDMPIVVHRYCPLTSERNLLTKHHTLLHPLLDIRDRTARCGMYSSAFYKILRKG
jgi:hypothetical protein